MTKEKMTAVVLAAGKGSRMGSKIQKQYRMLLGRPVITYALDAFEKSKADDIILVVGEGEADYVRKEIVDAFGYKKVRKIVVGGAERYESVWRGLCAIEEKEQEEAYVLIHDGARAFLTAEQANDCMEQVRQEKACVMGMPVKDTIKIVDQDGYSVSTPDRSSMWQVQTPQCFLLAEIREAYQKLMESENHSVTDDAMVMEAYGIRPVKMIRGSYENIKITTPEDLILGEAILRANEEEAVDN